MTHSRKLLILSAMLGGAALLALTWWGWQISDASLLLLGARLC